MSMTLEFFNAGERCIGRLPITQQDRSQVNLQMEPPSKLKDGQKLMLNRYMILNKHSGSGVARELGEGAATPLHSRLLQHFGFFLASIIRDGGDQ